MRALFGFSRYLVLLAVFGLLLAALAVFVFGLIATVNTVVAVFQHEPINAEGARVLSVGMIEMIDLFLLGTILFITAVGLYELFIDPGLREVLPSWMSVGSLDQLKFNLLAVIVVMLAVLFLGAAASYEFTPEGAGVLNYGAAVALVIAAAGLAVYLFARVHHMGGGHSEPAGHAEAAPETVAASGGHEEHAH